METMKINDLGDLFYGMATGKVDNFRVTDPYSVCVVIGVPPLPYKHQELADAYSTDMPVTFRNPDSMDGIYPGDVYMDGEGTWKITGDMGYPIVCAAGGDSIAEAQMKAYEKVRNIIIPNAMYREDIGDLIPGKIMAINRFLQHEGVPV
jgi:phosphoribosylamine-glycine ligase